MVTAGTGLIFGAVLLTSFSSLAGGSIFKSHKTRTYNPDGVSSVGVYVCGSLECPPVRIVEGDCDTVPNATKKFGVCVCNEGFVAHGEKCKSLCEATPIENCATCEIQGGQPTCTTCQDGYYLWNNQCLSCPDAKAKTCDEEGGICTNECEEPVKLCQADDDCNQKNECIVCDTETNMCKNGCERVEYLESTGTQWIDTGYAWKTEYAHILYDIKFTKIITGKNSVDSSLNDRKWFGNYLVSYKKNNEDIIGVQFYVGDSFLDRAGADALLNKQYTIEMQTLSSGRYRLNYTNQSEKTGTYNGSVRSGKNTYIFSQSGISNPVARSPDGARIYYLKMWDDNALVRDFVPVIAPNGKACMFNRVPDEEDGKLKLYCDANGGTFKTNKDN